MCGGGDSKGVRQFLDICQTLRTVLHTHFFSRRYMLQECTSHRQPLATHTSMSSARRASATAWCRSWLRLVRSWQLRRIDHKGDRPNPSLETDGHHVRRRLPHHLDPGRPWPCLVSILLEQGPRSLAVAPRQVPVMEPSFREYLDYHWYALGLPYTLFGRSPTVGCCQGRYSFPFSPEGSSSMTYDITLATRQSA